MRIASTISGAIVAIFTLTQVASATIANHFCTTDGDTDVINFNFFGNGLADGWDFGVYDFDGQMEDGITLLTGSISTPFQAAEFQVRQDYSSGQWTLCVTNGISAGDSLVLGNSEDFSFYFASNSGYFAPEVIISSDGDAYQFVHSEGGSVLGTDLNAVPLPPAIWIFSTSLLALLAVGDRNRLFKE
ncbi:hypothetical protein [Desulfovulcanus sp.]